MRCLSTTECTYLPTYLAQEEGVVTVHHSHTAITVRLVPGCLGVYPRLQLPCALATQNLAGGVRCFQRGFQKRFLLVFPPPLVSQPDNPPPPLLSCSLSLFWPFCLV